MQKKCKGKNTMQQKTNENCKQNARMQKNKCRNTPQNNAKQKCRKCRRKPKKWTSKLQKKYVWTPCNMKEVGPSKVNVENDKHRKT